MGFSPRLKGHTPLDLVDYLLSAPPLGRPARKGEFQFNIGREGGASVGEKRDFPTTDSTVGPVLSPVLYTTDPPSWSDCETEGGGSDSGLEGGAPRSPKAKSSPRRKPKKCVWPEDGLSPLTVFLTKI